MLSCAASKPGSATVNWAREDIRYFYPRKNYSLITCSYDSINYITVVEELRQTFEMICSALSPGGLFVFDSIMPNLIHSTDPFMERRIGEVLACIHTEILGDVSIRESEVTLTCLRSMSDIGTEVHVQRGYHIDDLRTILSMAGLTILEIKDFDRRTVSSTLERSGHLQFVCTAARRNVGETALPDLRQPRTMIDADVSQSPA